MLFFMIMVCVPITNTFADDDYDYEYEEEIGEEIDEEAYVKEFGDTQINVSNPDNESCGAISLSINSTADVAPVSNFDIAGIMLGMSFEDAQTAARENGLYINRPKNSIVYSINSDWKDNLDYECRQQKIYAPASLERCINSLARNRGLLYASEMHLIRPGTGETIDVFFSSNASDNRVYRILYKNDSGEAEGNSQKFQNQKQKKTASFWNSVVAKYGTPNADNYIWASSDNAFDPIMRAYAGHLELIDCGYKREDDSKNIQQSREKFVAKPYAF